MCWYEDRDGDQMRNVYVQHVNADGSIAFAANGIQPTISTSTQHFYPIIAYNTNTNETYVTWTETDASQNARGLRLQKFDSQGNSQFTDYGIAIIELGNQNPLAFKADVKDDQLVVLFTGDQNGSPANNDIRAYKVNSLGAFVWENNFVTIKSGGGGVTHQKATGFFNNQLVTAWENSQIYLQNLNFNGTLGIQQKPNYCPRRSNSY